MIRCKGCGRVWPSGTRFCGNCQATLGVQVCPNDHENPIGVQCCLTCGSRKLSKGVPVSNLRPVSWIVIVGIGLFLAPILIGQIGLGLTWAFQSLINAFAPILVALAVLSFLLAPILGEKGGKVISELWIGLFKVLGGFVVLVGRLLIGLLKGKSSN